MIFDEIPDTLGKYVKPTAQRSLSLFLSLLGARTRLAFVGLHWVQHEFDRLLLVVRLVALGPVIADSVSKDAAVAVEVGRSDGSADVRVALEPVLGVLVPEVECAVGASGREGAMLGVE